MRFPEISTIPTGTESDLEFLHAIHTGMVGVMFMSRSNPKMLEGIDGVSRRLPAVFPDPNGSHDPKGANTDGITAKTWRIVHLSLRATGLGCTLSGAIL